MIILSVPYHDANSLIEYADADYIEYRLDYCLAPSQIDFGAFSGKHILTWRGLQTCSPNLEKMLGSLALVDLDIKQYPQAAKYLDKLIVSLHLAKYDAKAIADFLSLNLTCFAQKVVFEAASFTEICECSRLIAASGKRVIFNVNGKWAAFQRSLYTFWGSWAVYLYLNQSTYPGQLSLKNYRLIAGKGIAPQSQIYGIIGGAQVNISLSLKHYNQLFRGSDWHYLPIPAVSAQEALEILKWLETKFILRAFSITSPFKRSLPQAMEQINGIYNSLLWNKGQFTWHNTDLIALNNCLQELQIQPSDSILIYGSGDCAEAFIQELQGLGYKELYLSARNSFSSNRIRDIYRLPQYTPNKVKLLINASAGLSFATEPGSKIPFFESLIELPYSSTKKSSLCNYALANHLPYIEGERFFSWQFAAQKACWGL